MSVKDVTRQALALGVPLLTVACTVSRPEQTRYILHLADAESISSIVDRTAEIAHVTVQSSKPKWEGGARSSKFVLGGSGVTMVVLNAVLDDCNGDTVEKLEFSETDYEIFIAKTGLIWRSAALYRKLPQILATEASRRGGRVTRLGKDQLYCKSTSSQARK